MKLVGAVPAALLPLHEDLAVDESSYARHVRDLAGVPGVGGVVVNGHAAEVTSLTAVERRRAVAIAAEQVSEVPLVAGVFAQSSHEGVEVAREAVREGADALLVFPLPALALGASQEMAYEHVRRIAAAVDVPLVVFSYPASTGMAYDAATLRRLCDIDAVCAVKEWSLDIARHEVTLQIVRSADHQVSLLTSFSTHLLPALVVGADGILSGHGSVVAPLHAELLRQVGGGDLAAASATYGRLQILTRVVYAAPMANMYARMKEHLVMLGRPFTTAVRPPLQPVGDVERKRLRQALVDAGLLDEDADRSGS
jgi:4-hydroxy-tetrahydrodipicolinate synthase